MTYRCVLLIVLSIFFKTNAYARAPLFIACSSNFVPILESLAKHFKAHKIIIIQGASAKLLTQINNGLPTDIFLSANKTYPQTLFKIQKATTPFVYAVGELILLTKKEHKRKDILAYLRSHQTGIGIANPMLAPYGVPAMHFLVSIDLWEPIKDKVILGENINQTFQQMVSGNLDAAFVTDSQWRHFQILHPDDSKQFYAYHVPAPHNRVIQYGNILTASNNMDAAKQFVDYLLHDKHARELIEHAGYHLPKT